MSRGRRVGQTSICAWCSLPGHTDPCCHVRARGATEPDEADRAAQEALPPPINGRFGAGDIRFLIAKLIRSGGKL